MMEDAATRDQSSWFQATARQRVAGLLDPNSFTEFLGPSERVQSPHLHLFDLPSAFDDGVVIGRGKLVGAAVLVAAQEGQFMGGTFGEVIAVLLAQVVGDHLVGFINRGLINFQLHRRRFKVQRQRGFVADAVLEGVATHVAAGVFDRTKGIESVVLSLIDGRASKTEEEGVW